MAGPIRISILGDARDALSAFKKVENQASKTDSNLSKFGGKFKGAFAAVGAAFAAAGIAEGFKKVIDLGADLQASVGATKQIFGDASKEVLAFGDNAAKSLGVTKAEALTATKQFGAFYTAIGFTNKQAAKMSIKFTDAAGNLAAFGDSTPTEALDAMTSALRGEYDPLQKYIPTVNAAAVQQKAMALTGKKNAKSLTDQDKALALQALVYDSVANKAGKAERAQGGFTIEMAKLKAQLKDIGAKIGAAFLPALGKAAAFINGKVLPALGALWKQYGPGVKAVLKQIGDVIQKSFGAAVTIVQSVFNAFKEGDGAIGGIKANFEKVGALFQNIFGSAEFSGIFDSIKTGVQSLKEPFEKLSKTVLPIIQEIQKFVVDKIQSMLPQIKDTLKTIGDAFSAAFEAIRAVVDTVTKIITFIWENFGTQIKNYIGAVLEGIVKVIKGVFEIIKGIFKVISGVLTGDWGKAWDGVKDIVKGAVDIVLGIFGVFQAQVAIVMAVIGKAIGAAWDFVKTKTIAAWNAVKNAVLTAFNAVKNFISTSISNVKNTISAGWEAVKSKTSSAWNSFKSTISDAIGKAVLFVRELPGKIKSALGNLAGLLVQAGRDAIQGFINGMGALLGSVIEKGKQLAHAALDAVKGALHIGSPSKAMKQLGIFTGQGFILGLSSTSAKLVSTTKSLYSKVIAAFPDITKTITTGKGKNKKTTKVTTENKTQNALIKMIQNGNKKLTNLVARRESIAKALATATKNVANLQKAKADLIAKITETVRDSFKLIDDTAAQSFAGILQRAKRAVQQAQAFTKNLVTLKARGLSSAALQELAEAGPQAAAQTIASLLKGTPAQIKELNSAYGALAKAGTSAGTTVASTLYDAGIKAAQGLVAGLQKQQSAIEKQMLAIAKSMQAAIKKALGIKSPSRVFESIGAQTIKGFQQGFDSITGKSISAKLAKDLTKVTPRVSPTYAGVSVVSAAGMGGVNNYINMGIVTDPIATAREVKKLGDTYYASTGRKMVS